MLLGAVPRTTDFPGGVDTIHNYYESLVLDEILRTNERSQKDQDFLADTACVALNHLPPRYIRHNVDMTFFMSSQELSEVYKKVEKAVKEAIAYVTEREAARAAMREQETSDADAE